MLKFCFSEGTSHLLCYKKKFTWVNFKDFFTLSDDSQLGNIPASKEKGALSRCTKSKTLGGRRSESY